MVFERKEIEQAIVGSKLVFDKAFKELVASDSIDDIESFFSICFNQLYSIRDICKFKLDLNEEIKGELSYED